MNTGVIQYLETLIQDFKKGTITWSSIEVVYGNDSLPYTGVPLQKCATGDNIVSIKMAFTNKEQAKNFVKKSTHLRWAL